MILMMLCHEFRVAYEVNLGFGCFGTVLLKLLPNCMNMMDFYTEYALLLCVTSPLEIT